MKKVVRAVSLMLLMAGVCGNAFAEENENIVYHTSANSALPDNVFIFLGKCISTNTCHQ